MLPTSIDWGFMRSEVQKFMPDTVTINSVAISRDRYGNETKSYTVVSTPKAKIYDVSGSERQLIAALINEGTDTFEAAKLDLPYGTTITTEHEILTADGKYWQVVQTNSTQTFTAITQALLYRHLRNQTVTP